jgi:hypothetical protein
MNSVAARSLCRRYNGRTIEIRRRPPSRNANRIVGLPDMQRKPVILRIGRDRRDAKLRAGARNADRDLAAIGNQQTGDRGADGGPVRRYRHVYFTLTHAQPYFRSRIAISRPTPAIRTTFPSSAFIARFPPVTPGEFC